MPIIASVEEMLEHAASPYRCGSLEDAIYFMRLIQHFAALRGADHSVEEVNGMIERFDAELEPRELPDGAMRQIFALQIVLNHDSW